MGFSTKKMLPRSNSSSVPSGKKKHQRIGFANATGDPHGLNRIAGNVQAKIPISSSISTSGSENSTNSKHENGRPHLSRSRSVGADSKSIRNLHVNKQKASTDSGQGRAPSTKGNGSSNILPGSLPSSPCDSRKRQPDLRSVSSTEGCHKSARTDKTHFSVAAPKGSHSINLSFGNIYKASNSLISKNANINDVVPGVNRNMNSIVEQTPSNKRVLGSGRCHYGYGSIIKGSNNVEDTTGNGYVICSKNKTEKQKSLITRTPADNKTMEEQNAGNEYKKGCFMEAIPFSNKANAFCPQNISRCNNKATALAALNKVTEAVGECLEAIKYHGSYSHVHHHGSLYARLGKVDDANWNFKLSGMANSSEVEQSLSHLESHFRYTEKTQKVENWDHVLKESTSSIKAKADASNQAIAAKAKALLKHHKAKEALELLMAANKTLKMKSGKAFKGSSCLLILETQVNLYLGRFEEGVLAAEQAVNLDPSAESLTWLKSARGAADARKAGNEFFRAGKYLEACTMYGHGLQYVPTNSILLCNRAASRSKLGQWEKAIEDCNAALNNRPDYSKALLRRAQSNAKLGRWEESFRDYVALNKEIPGDRAIANSLLQVEMEFKKSKGNGASVKSSCRMRHD